MLNYIMRKFNPSLPFRHLAIQELIYLYWGPAKREGVCIKAAMADFKKVPLNLIALVCTAVSPIPIHVQNQLTPLHLCR